MGDNAPDVLVISEATSFSDITNIKMLSIGAGDTLWRESPSSMISPSLARAGIETINIVFSAGESSAVYKASRLLKDNYFRISLIYTTAHIQPGREEAIKVHRRSNQLSYTQVSPDDGTRTRDHPREKRSNPYLHHCRYSARREKTNLGLTSPRSNPVLHHASIAMTILHAELESNHYFMIILQNNY